MVVAQSSILYQQPYKKAANFIWGCFLTWGSKIGWWSDREVGVERETFDV
jgi:hypothetical protein